MKSVIGAMGACVIVCSAVAMANPTVSNLVVYAGTDGVAHVFYDLFEVSNYACIVTLRYDQHTNGTFTFIPSVSLKGDAGSANPVVPGTNKHIIWNFAQDFTNVTEDMVTTNTVKVTAAVWTITGINIQGATPHYAAPFLLDFDFTLRAANTNPITLPPHMIGRTCFEDGVAISASETASMLAQGRKSLDCFLTLDYSRSMKLSTNAQGQSAIRTMQDAVAEFLTAFEASEDPSLLQANVRAGLVESHAEDVEPHIVTPLTGNKEQLVADLEAIVSNHVQNYYGGTRWRDAVYTSLVAVASANEMGDAVRCVIFLSDGVDESSFITTNQLVTFAVANSIRIYAIGFGKELPQGQATLMAIANRTGGRYIVATNQAALAEQFSLLAQELKALYTLRWATLKRAAVPFAPSFSITAQGKTATSGTGFPAYQPTNYAGDVRVGQLRYVISPDAAANTQRVSVVLYCDYAPRQIRQFRFNLVSRFPYDAHFMTEANNGVIPNDWTQWVESASAPHSQWLVASSADPASDESSEVLYASFGPLLRLLFTNVTDYLALLMDLSASYVDTSVYSTVGGMSFAIAPIPNLPDPEKTYATNSFGQAAAPRVWDLSGTYRLDAADGLLTKKATFELRHLLMTLFAAPQVDQQMNSTWGAGTLIAVSSITKATYTLECAQVELKAKPGKAGVAVALKWQMFNSAFGNTPSGTMSFKGVLDTTAMSVGGTLQGSVLLEGVRDALPSTAVAFNLPKQPQDGSWQLRTETQEEPLAKGTAVLGVAYVVLSSGTSIQYELEGFRKAGRTTSSIALFTPGADKPALSLIMDANGTVLKMSGSVEGQRVSYKR